MRILLMILVAVGVAWGASYTWSPTVGFQWGNTANWTPAGSPGTGDTAVFTVASRCSVSTVTVGQIIIQGAADSIYGTNLTLDGPGSKIAIDATGKFYCYAALSFLSPPTTDTLFNIADGGVFAGTGAVQATYSYTQNYYISKLKYTGSGAWTLQNGSAAANIYLLDTFSIGSRALTVKKYSSDTMMFFTNNQHIACGTYNHGASNEFGVFIGKYGSSTLSITTFISTLTTGSVIDSFGTSQWTVSNWTYPAANYTKDIGTSTITMGGAGTVTTNNIDDAFYDLTIDAEANTVTFADSLKIATGGDYIVTSGNVTHAGQGIVSAGDASFNSTGTANLGNFITMTGASSTLHVESTAGAIDGADCAVRMNTATAGVIDIDKGITIKTLAVGATDTASLTGAATTTVTTDGTSISLASGTSLPGGFTIGTTAIDLKKSTLNVPAAWTYGTQTVDPDSSTVNFTGTDTSIVTPNGQPFWNFVSQKTGSGLCSLVVAGTDTLRVNDLTATGGVFAFRLPAYLTGNADFTGATVNSDANTSITFAACDLTATEIGDIPLVYPSNCITNMLNIRRLYRMEDK